VWFQNIDQHGQPNTQVGIGEEAPLAIQRRFISGMQYAIKIRKENEVSWVASCHAVIEVGSVK
jgi:hypothetical protein